MPANKLKILITGACGFVGKNIVEYLAANFPEKYRLFYPYHKELELLDTRQVEEFVKNNKINIIIHSAVVGGSRKTCYDKGSTDVIFRNLKMFFNIVRLEQYVKKIIVLGSGAEYDRANYKPKMKENYFDINVPSDGYGFSKYVCAKYIEKSRKIVNLRIFGIFGKYEDYTYKFISNSIVRNILRLPIIICQNVFFDYLYINDFNKILEHFIDNNSNYKNYNIVTGKIIDLVTIANEINEIAEKPSKIIVKNFELNTEYSGDNKRLLSEIKGFTFTPFKKSVKELYHWYSDNIDNIDINTIKKNVYLKYCRVKKLIR